MAIGLAKSLFGMTSTTEPTLPPSRSPLTMLPTVPLSSSHRMQDRFHLAPPARAEGSHVAPIGDGLTTRCGRARGVLALPCAGGLGNVGGVRANRPAEPGIGPRHDAQEGRVIGGVKIVGR